MRKIQTLFPEGERAGTLSRGSRPLVAFGARWRGLLRPS